MPEFFEPRDRATLVSGVRVIDIAADVDRSADVLLAPGRITLDPRAADVPDDALRIDGAGLWALPGLIDLQVHFRQPGFEHKEDIASGSRAALAGGVTTVVVMPNTKPTLDTAEAVAFQGAEAQRVHGVRVLVAAAATEGIAGKRLTDHAALQGAGAVAVTDDGYPLSDDALMRASLEQCAELDLLFMQHAEDMSLSHGEPMTRGATSEALGVSGQPADAEGAMVERDVALVGETGARYHVLHLSTARSLRAVRAAKAKGLAVTCEASPHHLLLTDEACAGGDTHFKMNPPLRSEADRQVLLAGIADRSIDAVATDHAPHSAEEKARLWPTCVKHYPPFEEYQARTDRDIPVFACEPRA